MHPNFCLLTKNDFDRLLAVLGGTEGVTVSETSEFLVQTGCPRAKFEEWLAAQWRQHDVEAVLAGKESAGPEPHVLFDKAENQIAVRVFTPTEQLLIENARHAREEGFDRVCQRIKETPGATNLVISEIHALAVACGGRNLTIPEVAILWEAFEIIIISLLRARCSTHNEGLRLTEAVNTLSMALAERDTVSPQARYAEAKVEARRLLEVDPALDAFPELLAIVKKHCSASSTEYLTNNIQLDPDQFLEMLSILAQDQADPTAVPNPQARIRSALNRARERWEERNRRRWMPATTEQTNALEDLTSWDSRNPPGSSR